MSHIVCMWKKLCKALNLHLSFIDQTQVCIRSVSDLCELSYLLSSTYRA